LVGENRELNKWEINTVEGIGILISLVPSTMKNKSSTLRSYKKTFLNMGKNKVDPWEVFAYTALIIVAILLIYRAKCSDRKIIWDNDFSSWWIL